MTEKIGPFNLIPQKVLDDRREEKKKKKLQSATTSSGTPEHPVLAADLSEVQAVSLARDFVTHYLNDEHEHELVRDYVDRMAREGGLTGLVSSMDGKVATDQMRDSLESIRAFMNQRQRTKGELYGYVKKISADGYDCSLIYKLAVFEAYLRRVGPRTVK